MAQYKGKINFQCRRLYQNKEIEKTGLTDPGQHVENYEINIPAIEDIDLSQFHKMTYEADSSRVVYCFYGKQKGAIDLGKNQLTLLGFTQDSRVKLRVNKYNVDPEGFALGAPFTKDRNLLISPYDIETYGNRPEDFLYLDPFELTVYPFKNDLGNVTGLRASEEMDDNGKKYVLVSNSRRTQHFSIGSYYIGNDLEYIGTKGDSTGYSRPNDPLNVLEASGWKQYQTQTWTGEQNVYSTIASGEKQFIGLRCYTASNGSEIVVNSSNNFVQYAGAGESKNFGFMMDKDKNVWCIYITGPAPNRGKETEYHVELTKLVDVPISTSSSYSPFAGGVIKGSATFMSPEDAKELNDLMIRLLNAKEETTVPDIVGPGNPFEDHTNIGGVVGGDVNLDEDITLDDALPNTSHAIFASAGGFIGTYDLTVDDLKKYTGTLNMLYDHSDDVLGGGKKAAKAAERLEQSTISVFTVPFKIPDELCSTAKFTIGNTKIAEDPTNWKSYLDTTENNHRDARYITMPIYTVEYPIPQIFHNYDNAIDYDGTTISITVPHSGKFPLPQNFIQSQKNGKEKHDMKIRFNFDLRSGQFIWQLFTDGRLEMEEPGDCACPIPLSVNDNSGILNSQLSRIASLGSVLSGLGMAAGGIATGNPAMIGLGATGAFGGIQGATTPQGSSAGQHMLGTSSMQGNLGWLGEQDIIITVERDIVWMPYDYDKTFGFPTKKSARLGSIKGFAVVPNAHLKMDIPENEKEELQKILSEGVFFGHEDDSV